MSTTCARPAPAVPQVTQQFANQLSERLQAVLQVISRESICDARQSKHWRSTLLMAQPVTATHQRGPSLPA
jgi:hypothetical protein